MSLSDWRLLFWYATVLAITLLGVVVAIVTSGFTIVDGYKTGFTECQATLEQQKVMINSSNEAIVDLSKTLRHWSDQYIDAQVDFKVGLITIANGDREMKMGIGGDEEVECGK